jgi:hypothetical protein
MRDNVSSAVNQQERLKIIGWIVGFVDGEGCFCVSINRNKTSKTGWQVIPEFVVTQGEKSIDSLKELEYFFGCGNIFVNHRYDNHREHLYRFCVRSKKDLKERIIPFFKENRLRTSKRYDFENFCKALELMYQKEHLTLEGIARIAKIASLMNRKQKSRFLESSHTIRQALS